jgi:hypothetical protein
VITLGTTDQAASPLDTGALVIRGTADADGDDQGWRYLGFPGRPGASTPPQAQDLRRADGSQFINFSVAMSYRHDGEAEEQNSVDLATRFDGSGFTALSNSEEIALGRGFIVWIFDNGRYPVAPSIALKTPDGFSAVGASDVTIGDASPSATADPSLSTDDDLFLLANPYAVPFDLNALGNPSSDEFSATVQIWEADATQGGNDPSGTDDGNVGSFVMRSRDASDPEEDRTISAWQGFLLTRSSTTGNSETAITFNASGRQTGTTAPFVGSKSRSTPEATRRRLALQLVGRAADSTVVALDKAAAVLFREGATRGRDRFDAPKIAPMGEGAVLSPVATAPSDTSLRAQESRPLPESPTTVPLAFRPGGSEAATYTIRAPEWPNVPDDWSVELIDTRGTAAPSDDRVHPMRPGGPGYSFDADGAATTSAVQTAKASPSPASDPASARSASAKKEAPRPVFRTLRLQEPRTSKKTQASGRTRASGEETAPLTRFRLRVRPSGALPVEMSSFEVVVHSEGARLEWQTASETKNAGFYVQHQRLEGADSTAAPEHWARLGFVEGQGTTTQPQRYRFETEALEIGRHAFRLQQVDTDGTTHTTEIKSAEVRLTSAYAVSAPYPNPARQAATLDVAVRSAQQVTVSVYDVLGRRVAVALQERLPGQETKQIQLPAHRWASGTYFVRIRGEDFTTTRRMTVVR